VNENQVDVVSMIGTIVFKGGGAECATGNVKRLLPGSNRLHVVLKPKYCCRVRNECSGRVINFSIH